MSSDWNPVKFGDTEFFEIATGGTPDTKKPEYYGDDIRWLKSGDIKGLYITESKNRISNLGLEESNARVHPAGSVMLAMSGRGKTRGTSTILKVPCACSQSVAAIIPQTNEFLPEFIHFNLAYRYYEIRNITGDEDRSGLNLGLIRKITIPKPELHEQIIISKVLTQLYLAAQLPIEIIKTIRELKASFMAKLFREGLQKKPQQKTEIGILPEDWDMVELGSMFDMQQGKNMSPKHRKGISPYPFLRTSNIMWGRLNLSNLDVMDFTDDERDKLAFKKDDLLVCEGGDVGRTSIWNDEMEDCYYQNHIHRLRKNDDDIHPEFIMYWMQAAYLIFGLYSGEKIKTTIPNLSQGRLKAFKVPKPKNLTEQVDISTKIRILDNKIELEEKRRRNFSQIFNTMLHKIMTREIQYTDEENDPFI